MKKIKNIIWDFDGVIVDSMPIRDKGFKKVFKNSRFKKEDVAALVEYHKKNGGLSRYEKFEYFYENIIDKDFYENTVGKQMKSIDTVVGAKLLASNYSRYCKTKLSDKSILKKDVNRFIRKYHKKLNMHILSASADIELQYIVRNLKLTKFMKTVNGSTPAHGKKDRLFELLSVFDMKAEETLLIGDSINDYHAACIYHVNFIGYNSKELKELSEKDASFPYLDKFPKKLKNVPFF